MALEVVEVVEVDEVVGEGGPSANTTRDLQIQLLVGSFCEVPEPSFPCVLLA